MAVTALHTFGWEKENELKSTLEEFLEENLTKTASRWDSIDFVSPSYAAELKSRRAKDKFGNPVYHDTHASWLLPACKIHTKTKGRKIVFYYFEGDNSLWYLWEDEVDWKTVFRTIPKHHTELHYYVPIDLWNRIY